MSPLRRWLGLSRAERLVIVEAVALLAVAPLCLRLLSLSRLMTLVDRPRKICAVHSPCRLVSLIEAVAASLPWPTTCLHRALAAAVVMNRRGVAHELHIGVRRDGRSLAAHAWIEGHATTHGAYHSLVHWRSADLARR